MWLGEPKEKRMTNTRRRRVLRVITILIGLVLAVVTVAGLWLWSQLRASLPILDGVREVAGLQAPVTVQRDALGVPTITASTRLDVARATGFIHAQERFFQMDLMRRSSAGELSELFGPPALARDRSIRIHRFRNVAKASVQNMESRERTLLAAYVEGVNAGLDALEAPPFEYLLLGVDPAAWTAEDTALTVLSMFIDLQPEDGATENALGLIHDLLPQEWFDFLTPIGGPWDAPIDGDLLTTPPLPLELPWHAATATAEEPHGEAPDFVGSNSWAVAGEHTAHGGAIFANDMHLGLRVPNTWYRARFEWREDGADLAVTGVTLPGTPSIVVGSTGRVAWGFTNSYGDYVDLVQLEINPDDPQLYRGPDGSWLHFEHITEAIHIKGVTEDQVDFRWTVWGPVLDEDHRGRPRAVRWTAYSPEAVNVIMLDLERARNVDEALTIAATGGIPAQNFVCADADGRIGWTIMGRIPNRVGCDGRLPSGLECGWQGWLPVELYPKIVDPEVGRLWTANARVVGGEALAAIGDGGYDIGARAGQIRDDLLALETATEEDMLAIQLDDRALFLTPWRELLLNVLDDEATSDSPQRAAARGHIEDWGGRAAIDSVGYRLVREFRLSLHDELIDAYITAVLATEPDFPTWRLNQVEPAVWRLINEQPPELLPPSARSWREFMLAVFDDTLAEILEQAASLDEATWGARNTVRIRHPLSGGIPLVGRWLDMAPVELPGDSKMPRVQSPTFGASERMAVSPGREERGLFHMPGGQSGHPLSPYYRAGHEAWVNGEATPFLPGEPVHELRLVGCERQ